MTKREIKSVACIGEVMVELIAGEGGSAQIGVAGDTYNTAVYLRAVLGNTGVDVSYVTALGTDRYSDRILQAIQRHGLGDTHIERRGEHMPGLYAIDTDENGERSFSYWRDNSAARSLFEEPCNVSLDSLDRFDLIYLSGISIAILPVETRNALGDFLRQWRERGGTLAFDSNYRPRLWADVSTARSATTMFWELCDIALPSLDDEMALFGDRDESQVLKRLKNSGVSYGALKRGAAGPVVIGSQEKMPSFAPVSNVVDTTAAGDSFNAGFLAATIMQKPLGEAALAGHSLASKVVQQPGAVSKAVLGEIDRGANEQ